MNQERLSELPALRHLCLEGDFSGRSPAYFVRSPQPGLSRAAVEVIKKHVVAQGLGTLRLCFHRDSADRLHEMIIFHRKGTVFPPHKHLEKSESYQIIDGVLKIEIFSETGEILETHRLDSDDPDAPFLYKMHTNLWHRTDPVSDIAVFKETRPGPFTSNDSVNAPWGAATTVTTK